MMGCAWNTWGSCGRPESGPLRTPPGAPCFSPRLPGPTNVQYTHQPEPLIPTVPGPHSLLSGTSHPLCSAGFGAGAVRPGEEAVAQPHRQPTLSCMVLPSFHGASEVQLPSPPSF